MKVTVCFGAIKVIVPCGEGKLSVGELIEKSVQRYKKATGRSPDYWVQVHSLASQSEGGILDIDDVVSDVADDREKLTAHFEEQDPSKAQVVSNHLLGDGTSTCASSVGTASPINFSDMNHINNSNNKTHHMHHHTHHHNTTTTTNHINGTLEEDDEMDVVVTGEESDSKLLVRRGSDPVITNMITKSEVNGENAAIDKNANTLPAKTSDKPRSRRGSRDELLNSAFSRFGRDSAGSARQSLSSNHPSMNKWTDAQQKAENNVNSERGPDVMIEGDADAETDSIVLTNDGTPLGVHIISKIEQEDGSAFGIVVHSIEAGGRAARDGRLRPGDYIVQINGSDISLHSFNRAQEMLRDAMRNPTVKLTVQRDSFSSSESMVSSSTTPRENGHLEITIPPKSPGGKVPPIIPVRSPTTALSSPTTQGDPKSSNAKLIAPMSTRRIGRKLYIQLMKGPQGLGFSVTSRDNPTGGKNPIFIKNILPKGAAISDGRLKPGDRLMEVNGIEMTGKSQSEAVSILRSVKLGGVVNLVVSRQDSPVKMVPRQMPEDTVPVEDPVSSPQNRAVMTFEIPLNDTGSAGLGVSVKGKTSGATEEHASKDLGIFIKSVIHGGAASKDGRLRPNDQLLCINETSLANMSNGEAMETLRLAMSHEKSPRSTIALVIARRLDQQDPITHNNLSKSATTSPQGDRNVDSGLLSPLPQKDGHMPNSLSDGVLSSRTMNGGGRNEIVVQASVEPLHATTQRPHGAKVTYPSNDEEPIYSRSRKVSGGQTLPSSSGEVAMQADGSPAGQPMHLSIHSSPSARAPSPPQWLLDWDNGPKDGELSPLPDPDNFARDNYARASFSERRQGGSLDAKQMAWYKKTKGDIAKKQTTSAQKDVAASTSSLLRASSMDSLLDAKPSASGLEETSSKTMGPGLGMEKSSSLESLEVAVASVHHQREEFPGRPRAKVRRGRVCNDSFRAAVDRSYGDQSPNGDMPSMYTLMEAEENGGYGISRSGSSGGGDVQSAESIKKKKEKKDDKNKAKSSGTGFKGLFRFGKNRKSIGSENALKGKDKDNKNQMSETERLEQEEVERRKARQQAKEEHEKIQEEIQKLREAKIKEENQDALSKADRMMQLRQQYQQRHRDNQGQYMDDGEDDDDEYTRVDPNAHQDTRSQRERLEAARAEQRERERKNSRVSERGDRYERFPPEAEDRRKDRRDDRREDVYSEPKDRRDDRTSNNRYSEDPYADPRNLRNTQDRGRYYDDKYGRRNDAEENPYDRYNGKKEHGPPESRDEGYDRNQDNRSSEPSRQERRRSLKRTDRVEGSKNRPDARSQGKENIDTNRMDRRESNDKDRDRRPNDNRRPEYGTRRDRSGERKNPKREEQRRDDRHKDPRYDNRRDERYTEAEREDRYDSRDNQYDGRKDDRYYDQGNNGGRRQDDRRERPPPREERHHPDQRERYRNVPQQDDRHGYGSLDRPSRKPRGKDPSYYSMSESVGSRPDDDYSRTQNYSRYNNYNDHQQPPPRRTSYPNGPVANHTSHTSGPSGDRYRRANSTSDYLDYKERPPRSKSVSDQLADEYQYDSRRGGPHGSHKGHGRPNDMGKSRMYNDYDDAARV